LRDLGEELGVATILEGSVRREGNDIRITAQLIDAQIDEHIWAESYDREMTNIFAIQSDVAQKIALALKMTLTPDEKVRIERKPTANMEAYSLYLQGRYFWNKRTRDGINKGIDYFQLAIEKDPTFALAYAGIADSYILIGWFDWASPKETFPKAKEAAIKALEINTSLAEAYTSLGAIKMNYDWDWAGAERQFKRAIELNSNNANTYHWYAYYLSMMERHDEAFTEIRKAQNLDPLSLAINTSVGRMLHYQRRYDEAITHAFKLLDIDPDFILIYDLLYDVYVKKGSVEEAIL